MYSQKGNGMVTKLREYFYYRNLPRREAAGQPALSGGLMPNG